MATIAFVLKRLLAQRLLGLALIVTLGFTIGVLVAGPIYADAAREGILSSQALQSGVTVKNVRFRVDGSADFNYAQADRTVQQALEGIALERLLGQGRATVRLEATAPTGEGPAASLSLPILFRDGADSQVPVQGEFPSSPDQIVLPRSIAQQVRVGVGDLVTVSSGVISRDLTVSGTYPPFETETEFWFGPLNPFPAPDSQEPSPLLVSKEGFLSLAGVLELNPEYVWDAYTDLVGTPFVEAQQIPARLEGAASQMRATEELATVTVATAIDTLLDIVQTRTTNLRVPIYLVVFQIGAVALAVLAGVASLALSRQSFELAVLKSRGFTRGKLIGAQAAQTLVTAILAYPVGIVVGLGLARLATGANGPSPPGVTFPVRLSSAAIAAGVIGAVVGGLILILTSIPYVSRTVIEERRAISREERPLLARYPWEIFVGLLGAAAFYEVRSSGFLPAEQEGSLDPLVLLAPTLLLFAASFAVLRLLLFAFRWLDGVLGKTRSLSVYLATRRLGRSPGTSFATSLLLVLAAGLLVVSTSYRGIVVRNHSDSARQIVGADWRVEVASPDQPLVAMRDLPPSSTAIIRTEPGIPITGGQPPAAIALDPSTYASGGWWREDYGPFTLDQLLRRLRPPASGVELPEETSSIEVTITAPSNTAGMDLLASGLTAGDEIVQLSLGTLEEGTVTYATEPSGVTRLLAVMFAENDEVDAPSFVRLRVDQIEAVSGVRLALDLTDWELIRWRNSEGEVAVEGDALALSIDPGTSLVVGGIRPPEEALPAVLSPGLAQALGDSFETSIGGQVLAFERVGTVQAFPTMLGEFVVIPSPALLERAYRLPDSTLRINEVWAMGSENPRTGIEAAGFLPADIEDSARLVTLLAQLPQSLAVGMHFTAAAGGMGLVVIGVSAGLYFSQRRREFEFASLRAMGTDRGQITKVLLIEQAVLIGFAVIAGFALGLSLLRIMMPYVGKSLGAAFPAPLLVVDWSALAVFGAAILAATALALILALRALLRSSVTSVLRGEAE
jgi:FtsX-like permease family